MSESVAYETVYKNMEALTEAFSALKWQIKENSDRRTHPIDKRKNDKFNYVAINPEKGNLAYDIGIEEKGDTISLVWDPYGGSISNQLGSGFAKLNTQYCLAVARKNYDTVEIDEVLSDGSLLVSAYYD